VAERKKPHALLKPECSRALHRGLVRPRLQQDHRRPSRLIGAPAGPAERL